MGVLNRSLPSILKRAAGSSKVLVLLDYDGTLAPMESDPGAARMPEPVREWLDQLAQNPRATVGIISGRSLSDLVTHVALDGVVYAGNHGIEIRGRGLQFVEPMSYLVEPVLKGILAEACAQLEGLSDVWIENKRLTAAVHVRGASEAVRTQVAEILLRLVHGVPQFQCRAGLHSFDIVPRNGWHKGTAAQWIRRQLGLDSALTLYVGDDLTDEDAFAALPGSVTVKVGAAPTQACYVANSPAEVWALLAQLAGVLSRPMTMATGDSDAARSQILPELGSDYRRM